jgi:P4 family phage/plasmid primase-like protien
MNMNRRMMSMALSLASNGLLIVPMHAARNGQCTCHNGGACPSPGKHPLTPHGLRDASSDSAVVKRWWRDNPDASIGIAMGPESGLIAIDVDPRNGGTATLQKKETELGKLPNTVTSLTGGGGLHLVFKHPSFRVSKDSHGKLLGLGLDVLAEGSIMIVPPSRHKACKRYRWEAGKSLLEMKPADLPDAWLVRLRGDQISDPAKPAAEDSAPIVEGQRNTRLTSLAGRLHNTGISPDVLLAALVAENNSACKPPLDETEVKKIAESVGQYRVKGDDAGSDAAEQVMQLVLQQHFAGGEHLMFCTDGQFWLFDLRKWAPLPKTSLQRRVLNTLEKMADNHRQATSALMGQVMTLLTAKVAIDDDRLRFVSEPPNVINCANGELWIGDDGAVDLRPHSAKSYLRHCLDISYDPKAKSPIYDAAVRQIFSKAPNVKAMIRHWHDVSGYFIAPSRKMPHIIVLRGSGSNAKTKLVETVTKILGTDLVTYARIENLEKNRFFIGSLLGKTMLVDDDVKAGTRLPDGELKKISEPKILTGERKHGSMFNFTIRTVPVLICNNPPSIADLSWGMQRRLMVIPFDRTFRTNADPDLFPKIWASELPGILNRALRGLRRLARRNWRFKEPACVKNATSRLLADANPVPAFIADKCIKNPSASYWMKDLYAAYNTWSNEMGFTKVQQQSTVRRNLEQLGYTVKHGNKGDKVIGLKLR